MKKYLFIVLLTLLLSIPVLALAWLNMGPTQPVSGALGYVLEENFGASDDESRWFAYNNVNYQSQTFTVTKSYTLTRVAAKLGKTGTPTLNITAYIYNVDAGGVKPTGSPIATSTNTIATGDIVSNNFYNFDFTGLSLSTSGGTNSDGEYCLVLYGTGGTIGNYPHQRSDTEASGAIYSSADGSTWNSRYSGECVTFNTYSGG